MPNATYWPAISTGHRPWRTSPPAKPSRTQAAACKREYYRAAGLLVEAPPSDAILTSRYAGVGDKAAGSSKVPSAAAPAAASDRLTPWSPDQWAEWDQRMEKVEEMQAMIYAQNERLLLGGNAIWQLGQDTNSLLNHLVEKFNKWQFLEDEEKENAAVNMPAFIMARPGCDAKQVAPCVHSAQQVQACFFDGAANATRTAATERQAATFVRNVFTQDGQAQTIDEMERSKPPVLAPGSSSAVRGWEKQPPKGRGYVTVDEPSDKHKLKRLLALHAGLRACAATAESRCASAAPTMVFTSPPASSHRKFSGPMNRCTIDDVNEYLRSPESGRLAHGVRLQARHRGERRPHPPAVMGWGQQPVWNFVLVEGVVNRYWSEYSAVDKSHKRFRSRVTHVTHLDERQVPQTGGEPRGLPHTPARHFCPRRHWIGETGWRLARAHTQLIMDAGRMVLWGAAAAQ